ncbi:MAG TPA: phytanoyl-CoA dioxygenase family protein [Geminicoccaceae bacterium]|nr:phytanoyl-CoA dioxygenase family protein [Geminicoccaceae bacterium]
MATAHLAPDADVDFAFPLADPRAFAAFFAEQGYVVLRDAVPKDLCEAAKAAFERDVKPSRDYFKRHESSEFERHVFTEAGFMKYPIMNIQDLSAHSFNEFRQNGLNMLTCHNIRDAMNLILGEQGRIVHTMYFDGNQETWAHRDSHYIDAEQTGRMIGVWIAAEDIHPGAGRFYVYARSHRTPTPPELALDQIDPNGREYKRRMAEFARASSLRLVAPELRQGDAILWSSLTIHGSLAATSPDHSRRSFTAHYIPVSQSYLWTRKTPGSELQAAVNGVEIILHGDKPRTWIQARPGAARAFLRTHAPLLFRGLRAARLRWQNLTARG